MQTYTMSIRGQIFQMLLEKALARMELIEKGAPAETQDIDLCNAISHSRHKKVGGGFRFFIKLTAEDTLRLMDWITDKDPKILRDNRDHLRRQATELLEAERA